MADNVEPAAEAEAEAEADADAQGKQPRRRLRVPASALAWVCYFVALIVVLITYTALMDCYTPITGDAYIQAYVTRIAPRISGVVSAVHIKDNQRVAAGQPLFEVDDRPYAYAAEQLEATLTLAHKDVNLLQQDLNIVLDVIKQVEADLAFAQSEFERYAKTARAGASPEYQLDRARDRLSTKRAMLAEARTRRIKAEVNLAAKVDGVNAIVSKAEADLKRARYDLEHTRITAPTNGIVTNLQLTPGTYVAAGQPVLTFVDTDSWWIVANMRENSLPRLHAGQRARIALSLAPGRIFPAEVVSVGWGVSGGQGVPSGDLPDIKSPTDWVTLAKRFPVRLRLTADDPPPLRVGGAVTVVIYTSDNPILNGLADLWLWISSEINYLY